MGKGEEVGETRLENCGRLLCSTCKLSGPVSHGGLFMVFKKKTAQCTLVRYAHG